MKNTTVLYIDDEADTEKFASKFDIFREGGINVIPIISVGDALPQIRDLQNEIKLIILDIIMPPHNTYTLEETSGGTETGLRLLQDIRQNFPNIPIMIVSIRRKQVVNDVLEKFNVTKYLEKPIPASHILCAIKNILGCDK